jgi:hypothetical protein
MSDVDGYGVRGLGKGADMDFHREDVEPCFPMWVFSYSAKHPWTLKAHVELSKGDIVETDERSWAQLGFIRGNLFSNNPKVCNDPCHGFLANSHVDWAMRSQGKVVNLEKERAPSNRGDT